MTQNVRLIRCYYPKAGVSQTGLDCRTNIKNKHTQMLHLIITLIETTFLLYLRAFQGLFHPRTEKYVRSSNMFPKNRVTQRISSYNCRKYRERAPKKTHTYGENRPMSPPPPSANLDSHRFSRPQVPHAAREVFGVVR